MGDETKSAIELVLEERRRQIESEGWTPEHDDKHRCGQLAQAAACYLMGKPFRYLNGYLNGVHFENEPRLTLAWPWDAAWWKPSPTDRKRDIVKALALGLAELERLERQAAKSTAPDNNQQ